VKKTQKDGLNCVGFYKKFLNISMDQGLKQQFRV